MDECLAKALIAGAFLTACGIGVSGTGAPVDPPTVVDAADASIEAGTPPGHTAPINEVFGDAGAAKPPAFCDPSDPTLIACFTFDDVIRDESAYAQTVQVQGGPGFEGSLFGRAILVDDDTTLHVPNGTPWQAATPLTVEMWVNPARIPAAGTRAGLLDKDGSFGVFVYSDASVRCTMGGAASGVVMQSGTWTHIACVNDGTSVTLYANGVVQAQSDAGGVNPTSSFVAIGSNAPSGEHLTGAIDNLRVFSRARTADEIRAAVDGT